MMNRWLILPWSLFVITFVLLIYILIDKSVTIDHQASSYERLNARSSTLLLLVQKELLGSSYEHLRLALGEISKSSGPVSQIIEESSYVHINDLVFEFKDGKLVAVTEFGKFNSKK